MGSPLVEAEHQSHTAMERRGGKNKGKRSVREIIAEGKRLTRKEIAERILEQRVRRKELTVKRRDAATEGGKERRQATVNRSSLTTNARQISVAVVHWLPQLEARSGCTGRALSQAL